VAKKGKVPPYQIDLPGEWEDQTVYVFMGPDDSGVQHMVHLVIDPELENNDLISYANSRIDAMMESLQGAEILKEEPKTLASGRQVYECVYKWMPVEGQIKFNKAVYLINEGVGFTFMANFSKKTIKTIGVEVERMIDSFQPLVDAEEE
jgi:hypothetical protein